MDIIQTIHHAYPNMTKKQKNIAQYLLKNPEDLCYITLAQLSQRTCTSELTLLRFCKKIGYNSFLELKEEFRSYTQSMVSALCATSYFPPQINDAQSTSRLELLRQIGREEAHAAQDFYSSLDLAPIVAGAKKIRASHRVFLCAHDLSRSLATFAQARLSLLKITANFVDLTDLEQTQDMLEQLSSDDMVIFFSFPKYYYALSSIAKNAASKHAAILTITDSTASPCAAYSQHLLLCRTSTRVFYNSFSLPMALLNLLLSYIVIDMGCEAPNTIPIT